MITLYHDAIHLLKSLIAIESFSKQEEGTADRIESFFAERSISFQRHLNNVWARNRHFDPGKPTILLNSHHDTVRPNSGWTRDPFMPVEEAGKLYGLGSNDAGGALVSLIATFLHFYQRTDLSFNLVVAATAEEENSGRNGIEAAWPRLGRIDLAIVGEPTEMQLAIAEKGLLVLDCLARGISGHAARDTGVNAIEKAIEAINWFHSYRFEKESALLGPVKMTVTMIEAGTQHNVIPDQCRFTVDVRTTDAYDNLAVLEEIRARVDCEVTPRSTRLNPSGISPDHPIARAAQAIGMGRFGSPTTSDQAVIPAPSVKLGPGKSERSHTADEFIHLEEVKQGVKRYIELLERLNRNNPKNLATEPQSSQRTET